MWLPTHIMISRLIQLCKELNKSLRVGAVGGWPGQMSVPRNTKYEPEIYCSPFLSPSAISSSTQLSPCTTMWT